MDQDKPTRWGLIAIAAVLILAVGAYSVRNFLLTPNAIPMKDFVEYWAAAVVNLRGGNPYDGEQLLGLQREATNDPELDIATMMWNPPWALVLVTPLGYLPAQPAHFLFIGLQLGCLILSSIWLWGIYHGPRDRIWVAWILAIGFGPSLFLLLYGQIGGLLLLGLAGFLHYHRQDRPAIAGAFAALTAIKPHLLFAFGLILVLDALVSRRGRIALISGGIAIVLAALAALAVNPEIYHYYRTAGWVGSSDVHFSPKDWYQPLLSYWFRIAINPDQFFWQFLPTAVVALIYAVYWWKNRETWDWEREMPMLVFASVLTTAYGAWIFDLVVLLVPAFAVATRLTMREGKAKRIFAALVLLVSLLCIFSPQLKDLIEGSTAFGLHLFIWVAPTLFVIYLLARRSVTRTFPGSPTQT